MKKEYELRSIGMDLNAVASRVSEVLNIDKMYGQEVDTKKQWKLEVFYVTER